MSNVPEATNVVIQSLVNLLAALIIAVAPIIIARVTLWAKRQWNAFKLSQPEHIQKMLEAAAVFGASFAEKAGPGIKELGHDKMDAALDAAKGWLSHQGFEVDDALLRHAIEVVLFNDPEKFPSSKG